MGVKESRKAGFQSYLFRKYKETVKFWHNTWGMYNPSTDHLQFSADNLENPRLGAKECIVLSCFLYFLNVLNKGKTMCTLTTGCQEQSG